MDCSTLLAKFPGKVLLPGSPGYATSKKSYFAAFENEVSPACFIQPTNAQEVSEIIKYAGSASSTEKNQIKLAIRSGGHTAWASSANINGGITVDLSNLIENKVVVDKQTNLATIGCGLRWGDVYRTLEAQGLMVVGGRVSKVGVGGSSLGGGLSSLSPKRGWVCDNIVNYTVVLASGDIVQANQDTNKDLFVALKGGSNNFGVVIEFQTPVFEFGKMWGGSIYYEKSAYPKLIQALHDFSVGLPEDENASLIVATSFISGMGEVCVSNLYYTQPTTNPPSLEPFVHIQPQLGTNTLRTDSLLGFAEEQAAFSTDGARQWFFTTSFRVDVQLMTDIRELWKTAVAKVETVEGLMFSLVFQPVTEGFLAASQAHGENSLGLYVRDGPFIICLINTVHANAVSDDLVSSTVLNLIEQIDTLSPSRGLYTRYKFLNYGFGGQKILEGYGAINVEKLRAVSKKYDPTGFFQTIVPGGFKISHVAS